ncbi:MAG TPA: heme exporter protein CcmD [Alphaproteobacteria bacterium]|jgi:heme exporter protein D
MAAFESFLAMGGYAAYVWPAYAIAAAVLAGLVVVSLRELGRRARELAAAEAALPARRRRGDRGDA